MNPIRISAEELIKLEMSRMQSPTIPASPVTGKWTVPIILGVVFIAAIGFAIYATNKFYKTSNIQKTQNDNKEKK